MPYSYKIFLFLFIFRTNRPLRVIFLCRHQHRFVSFSVVKIQQQFYPMNKLFSRASVGVLVAFFMFSCITPTRLDRLPITSVRFLSEFSVPHRTLFKGTTVGGLSGIDYQAAESLYYLIADDRSDINPARFYTAKIVISENRIDTVELLRVDTIRQENGEPFPNKLINPSLTPDPEAIRYLASNNTLVWTSEGERIVRNNLLVLTNPSINVMSKEGRLVDTFPIPANMYMHSTEKGPRQNGVFEGLTFTPDGKTMFVSVEEPLYEDGPRAGLKDTTGWIRILRYDVATKRPTAQYAYQIDPVVQEPISPGLFVVNGVPDILAINDQQLLVIERSFSTGRLTSNVRLYLADLKNAEDIATVSSLQATPVKRPVRKTQLLNMDSLGRWIDNVEGMTFGPRLLNGKRSLLFVTDDNFSPIERTQFFLFELSE